jgi:hypothetical protein
MSIEFKINRGVGSLIDYIKTNIRNNISQAYKNNLFEVKDEENLNKIISIINGSVDQGLSLGYAEVEAALREIESDNKKNKK